MKNEQAIWEEILEEVCKCYPDEVGNRPCDWGAYCDKCQAPWIQELFEKRLKE